MLIVQMIAGQRLEHLSTPTASGRKGKQADHSILCKQHDLHANSVKVFPRGWGVSVGADTYNGRMRCHQTAVPTSNSTKNALTRVDCDGLDVRVVDGIGRGMIPSRTVGRHHEEIPLGIDALASRMHLREWNINRDSMPRVDLVINRLRTQGDQSIMNTRRSSTCSQDPQMRRTPDPSSSSSTPANSKPLFFGLSFSNSALMRSRAVSTNGARK